MDDVFVLTVPYQESELEFECKLQLYGYIHRFEVNINGTLVQFEPDEERNYRALVSAEQLENKMNHLSYGLLQAIAKQLESLH